MSSTRPVHESSTQSLRTETPSAVVHSLCTVALTMASAAAGATIAVAVEGCAGVTGTDSAFGAATDAVAVGSTGAGIAPGPPAGACIDCALELNRARAAAEFMSVRGPHEAVVATTAAASVAAIEPRHAGAARRGRWVC